MAILKETINLENGMLVKIHLQPMPKKTEGKYPLIIDGNFPEVSFSFFEKDVMIKKLTWNHVQSKHKYVALKGQYRLTPDDVDELSEKVWSIIINYGIFPTALVLRDAVVVKP